MSDEAMGKGPSKYCDVLNALCDMQASFVYAARKHVLVEAEQAIVNLERSDAALREELAQAKEERDEFVKCFTTEIIFRKTAERELARVQQELEEYRSIAEQIGAEKAVSQLAQVKQESLDRIASHQREIAGWEASVQQLQARLAELEGKP